ncbi:MAG: cytochrome P450 [Myxococcales bacterium]|nr:cytochrome P450 [Myxococcales bacterium]
MPDTTTSPRPAHDARAAATRPRRAAPQLRGGLPLLGHTLSFIRDLTGLLTRAREECGEVASIKVLGRRIILVTGPKGQEEVFRAPDDVLSPKAAYKMMVPVFGKGVVYDCDDARMQEQLMMLMPALKNRRMRTYSGIVARETEQSLRGWGERGVIDIYEYMQTLTSFTSSHCLLGPEFRGEMSAEFSRVYADLERGIVPIGYLNAHLPIPAFRKRDRARARLGEMVSEIVERRRSSGRREEDFLQTLMESRYKDGSGLTSHEITGMLVAAMFAGHHTSSVTAAWSILELLRNPEWMQHVRRELDRVYAGDRAVDFASLRELVKTEWVVKEALRLHPPLFILLRAALQDTTVLGYQIRRGDWIALSPSVAHRIEQVFPEAGSFCPHRYGPPEPEDLQPFAYIAFGGGRHKCLGNAFALLQIKAILAILLQSFDFELFGDPIEADFHGLVIGPKLPARVRYRRRAKAARVDAEAPADEDADADADEDAIEDAIEDAVEDAAHERPAAARPFRVIVDRDLCQGHGVCEGELAEVFSVVDGAVQLTTDTPPPELRARAEEACRYCPQRALSVVDL